MRSDTMTGMPDADTERPAWAERIHRERLARDWTQADVVAAMRSFSPSPLPDGLLDQWKRWERGRSKPDEFYRPIIAAVFGTVTESVFGGPRLVTPPNRDELLLSRSGMDTLELVQRVRRSSVDDATLDALLLTVEQLCCDYGHRDSTDLIKDAREWLASITGLLDQRLSFTQHRDALEAAAWLTLLLGCLEYDTGEPGAETTRTAAMQLGEEAGNLSIVGWAHEMTAWFDLTKGRYRKVVAAAQAGQDAAPGRSVAVQLLTQEAKAWARMGNRRNVERTLENGRVLLDSLPYPERPDHHFIVDHDKFDYYAMDCYRITGDDTLAATQANEVLRKTPRINGIDQAPMRTAEAMLTLGVVAARNGDQDQALKHGHDALAIDRRSKPSLLMVGSELDNALSKRFPDSAEVVEFHHALLTATGQEVR